MGLITPEDYKQWEKEMAELIPCDACCMLNQMQPCEACENNKQKPLTGQEYRHELGRISRNN